MHELTPKKLPTWKPVKVYKTTNKQLHRLPQTWATLALCLVVICALAHPFVWIILVCFVVGALIWIGRVAKYRTTSF